MGTYKEAKINELRELRKYYMEVVRENKQVIKKLELVNKLLVDACSECTTKIRRLELDIS